MEEEQKKQHGGYRENGGRKPKGGVGSVHVSYRMNKYYHDLIMDNHDCRLSEWMDKAVKEKLRREGLL